MICIVLPPLKNNNQLFFFWGVAKDYVMRVARIMDTFLFVSCTCFIIMYMRF